MWLPRLQISWGQHGAHLGPVGPRSVPCWPQEHCYQGMFAGWRATLGNMARLYSTRIIHTACLVLNAIIRCTACTEYEFCHYQNIEGQSRVVLELPRHTHSIPQSCPYLCLSDPLCTAVTFDRGRDVCRLHYEYDGDSCISRVNTHGNTFWIPKKHDSCPNVSIMVLIYFHDMLDSTSSSSSSSSSSSTTTTSSSYLSTTTTTAAAAAAVA